MEDDLEECYKALNEYYDSITKWNNRILDGIEKRIGSGFRKDLEIVFDGISYGFLSLKREPIGKFKQQEEYGCIVGWWSNSYSVGTEGDAYEGTISIKLADYVYLIIPYSE